MNDMYEDNTYATHSFAEKCLIDNVFILFNFCEEYLRNTHCLIMVAIVRPYKRSYYANVLQT